MYPIHVYGFRQIIMSLGFPWLANSPNYQNAIEILDCPIPFCKRSFVRFKGHFAGGLSAKERVASDGVQIVDDSFSRAGAPSPGELREMIVP